MKKFFALLLAALLLLSLAACGETTPENTVYVLQENQTCLRTFANGSFQIRLPQSGTVLKGRKEQAKYIPYITDELVAEAEQYFMENGNGHVDSLVRNQEGYLCLSTEVIAPIPVEEREKERAGCWDHKHDILTKPITTQPIPAETP